VPYLRDPLLLAVNQVVMRRMDSNGCPCEFSDLRIFVPKSPSLRLERRAVRNVGVLRISGQPYRNSNSSGTEPETPKCQPQNADVSNRYEVMAKPEAQTRTEIRKVWNLVRISVRVHLRI